MRRTHIKQASCFFSGLLLFVILSQHVQGMENRQVTKGNVAVVEYCDLVTNPDRYDGKEVTVRATYRYGFEWQELFCLECRNIGKTWLEFDEDTVTQYKAILKEVSQRPGHSQHLPSVSAKRVCGSDIGNPSFYRMKRTQRPN